MRAAWGGRSAETDKQANTPLAVDLYPYRTSASHSPRLYSGARVNRTELYHLAPSRVARARALMC